MILPTPSLISSGWSSAAGFAVWRCAFPLVSWTWLAIPGWPLADVQPCKPADREAVDSSLLPAHAKATALIPHCNMAGLRRGGQWGPQSREPVLCRYAFLVVNAAVHFWHAARPLMRDGVRAQLLPGHQRLAEALRKVPEGQEWLGRTLCSLALCLMEVRQTAPRWC